MEVNELILNKIGTGDLCMIARDCQKTMYEQVTDILRSEITQKIYSPGKAIGTHEKLAKRFAVSLITIRKALDTLISEGLVVSKKGKGTYVADPPLQDGFNRLTGVSNVIALNNKTANVSVKSIHYITTPQSFSNEVRAGLGENCLNIKRTHEINGKIIGFANMYIPEKYASHFYIYKKRLTC
jgi:GntR family transcriptional regulator